MSNKKSPSFEVKSLLCLQSVSKLWNAVISDEVFKKAHHDQFKASSPKKLLLVKVNENLFEFRDLENPKIAMGKQHFPLKEFRNPKVVCSCDFLVLMKKPMDDNKYVLWNPCTNENQLFECPYLNWITPRACACGLCYDSTDDDNKFILIYKYFYAVYHVNRKYWTKKKNVDRKVRALDREMSQDYGQGISVDGCVFWSLDSSNKQLVHSYNTITYFDMKSDELKELPRPDFIGAYQSYRLTCLKGCVGLYGGRGLYHDRYFFGDGNYELDVWIMEQDGWTQLMKINCYNSVLINQYMRNIVLVGCMRNGEILFQAERELEYLVVDT
ncbi:hypothetical protein P3L10_011441 [Capsicum annuum]